MCTLTELVEVVGLKRRDSGCLVDLRNGQTRQSIAKCRWALLAILFDMSTSVSRCSALLSSRSLLPLQRAQVVLSAHVRLNHLCRCHGPFGTHGEAVVRVCKQIAPIHLGLCAFVSGFS